LPIFSSTSSSSLVISDGVLRIIRSYNNCIKKKFYILFLIADEFKILGSLENSSSFWRYEGGIYSNSLGTPQIILKD
jgi:hypothetical protein